MTTETDSQMLSRACEKLLNYDRVNVINDEAHQVTLELGGKSPHIVFDDAEIDNAVNRRACLSANRRDQK